MRILTDTEIQYAEKNYKDSVGKKNNGARIAVTMPDETQIYSTPVERKEEASRLQHTFICNEEKIYMYIISEN